MASYKAFMIYGLLLITITVVVQSIPIEKVKQIVESSLINHKQDIESEKTSSISSSTTAATTTETIAKTEITLTTSSSESLSSKSEDKNDMKKKRFINDEDQSDEILDNDSDEFDITLDNNHVLHTKIHETSATVHDNTEQSVDTDDSKLFSDIQMTPNELTDIVRRRRDIKFNDQSNRRRKRALGAYDFYGDDDDFYDPYGELIERQAYIRPIRSFAPIYWYPPVYERSIRSVLAPSAYETAQWPSLYSSTIDDDSIDDDDDDNDDENSVSIFNDDDNDYESNRYPILIQSSNNPFDNLQLQQQYNTDDLAIDEDYDENFNGNGDDDDDEFYNSFYLQEQPYYSRYELF